MWHKSLGNHRNAEVNIKIVNHKKNVDLLLNKTRNVDDNSFPVWQVINLN